MKKLLIADDDENILSTLKDILELNGYQVITARDGKEAIQKMHSDAPDLLILDLMMPEMDGASVSVEVNAGTSKGKIPVIYVSGLISSDAEKRCLPVKELRLHQREGVSPA